MILSSPAFRNGQKIPKQHSGEGADISPALKWSDVPAGCAELLLLCEDPDAPQPEPWVHWLVYSLSPSQTNGIPEGLSNQPVVERPLKARQGRNSFGTTGYGGPMPPLQHGTHRYYFKLYALDRPLDLPPGATKDAALRAMRGHVITEAELMGTYERRKAEAA
ncbi:MAG: hypothetical protein A2X94_13750 [Bdellovibrionales bacterium GWB1_55_8]|nr:MAG: hypothetical protein A2X94_13750 [Bdellovibrionales bacterium GWB1_55_8]